VINPISAAQFDLLSPEQQGWRTGLEGWNLIQPTYQVNWTGTIPNFAVTEEGITEKMFAHKDLTDRILPWIKKNKAHRSTLRFVARLGHGLKRDPPPNSRSWGDYFERNVDLIRLPPHFCGQVAYCLGVHAPGGIITSSAQKSDAARAKDNRRVGEFKRRQQYN
jgi:hypothetical protein